MHILQKYILDNNLNLAELANVLGYDIGNLSKVINGIIGVSPRLANTIKQKLQLDIEVTKRPKRYNTEKKEDFIVNEPEVIFDEKPNTLLYMNEDLKNEVIKLQRLVIEMQAKALGKSEPIIAIKSKVSAKS